MIKMTAFDKAWDFLKADESYTGQPKFGGNQKQPLDMHEYPPGSGNFMSLQDMLMARNADARKNMQRMDNNMRGRRGPNVGGQPSTNAIASRLPITPNPHTEVGRRIIENYPPIPNTITVDGKEMDRKKFFNQNRNNIMVSPTGNLSDIPEEQRWNPL